MMMVVMVMMVANTDMGGDGIVVMVMVVANIPMK